jgi:hypothetical protein
MKPVWTEDEWARRRAWEAAQQRFENILWFGTGLVMGAALTGLVLIIVDAL